MSRKAGRSSSPARERRIGTRNARFQQWQALLDNRTKRHQAGEFLVHGVRPITLAVDHGWPLRALLRPTDTPLSAWATDLIARATGGQHAAQVVDVAPPLLAELGDKADGAPELIAVAEMPLDRLDRIVVPPDGLVLLFDRPANPGNIGTLVRSADAFGACGVIVTGHAADVYDPRAVRASTGSLFALPVVRQGSPRDVLAWVAELRSTRGVDLQVVGTDESGEVDVDAADLTGARLLVVGNELRGMSAAWRESCDVVARIPIAGAASSLNASVAAGILCYEARRQRRSAARA
ncbi:TrmH family RNA methyltransferase [Actinopolymorpha sp. B9G3]|uniref:TrmH family RNA methyltransferase n=1 Tax=Actinopolymorpha sp. B9G3 TaxID=3158970 RepID=UPI0032D90CF3